MAKAFGAGVNAGLATIVTPAGTPLSSGGSQTNWSLTLPAGAACASDSAHGYHVYGFLVPASVDPATLTFTASGPGQGPSQGFPLYDLNFNNYGPADTAPTTGQVTNLPVFNFALFSIDGSGGTANVLPPGAYYIGLACVAATGSVDRFWDSQLTFSPNSADPNGETWTAQGNRCNFVLEACDFVSPAANLQDGQAVTVYFSSFSTPYIQECTPLGQTPLTCSPFTAVAGPTNTMGGTSSISYVVHTLPLPAHPADITCDNNHPCSIVVSEGGPGGPPIPNGFDQSNITFATATTNVPESAMAILLPLSFLAIGLAVLRRRFATPSR